MAKNSDVVYQFKISLQEIEPVIWRRIQVPSKYSFWDLHVAIQDAMGWLDYHLHAFRYKRPHGRVMEEIGIPDDDFDDIKVTPGWTVKIADFFKVPGQTIIYAYDFGDGWMHEILLEGILLADPKMIYPACLAGAGACPPEDCGSIPGYYELLETLKKRKGSEFEEMKTWLKGHAKNYWPYDPANFSPDEVKFDDPKKRFKIAFGKQKKGWVAAE
ncbi:MAG: plasmid pRiA4b ORF-3 family protein [Candidatus Ozemobacteraceae bacterium]